MDDSQLMGRTRVLPPAMVVARSPSPTPAAMARAETRKSPGSSFKAQVSALHAHQQEDFNQIVTKPKTRALVKVLEEYGKLNPHSWRCTCDPAGTGQSMSMHSTCPTCFLPALDALGESEMSSEARKQTIRATVENMEVQGALKRNSGVSIDDLVDALANTLDSTLSVRTASQDAGGRRMTLRRRMGRAKRTQRKKKSKHQKRKQSTLRKRMTKGKRGKKTRRYRR